MAEVSSKGQGAVCDPLIDAAEAFRRVLEQARSAANPRFPWYPYDSLGNMVHITRLLGGTGLDLRSLVSGQTILDLGCADGDFAFFLESLGASVVAVDHPRGNHNNLAGITALRGQLKSSVQIERMDLDSGLPLADRRFEFALALGLLYHLRNPMQFLDTLSRHSRYCILSTRVMRRVPGVREDVSAVPVAYLLGADELNADNSNFWIFTESALKRLFERTHWKLRSWVSVGDCAGSLPHTLEKDERAFCLLESCYGDVGLELLNGWHEPEDTGWRWTERKFSASAPGAGTLVASVYIPDALIDAHGPVALSLQVDGKPAGQQQYAVPGLYTFKSRVTGTRLDFVVSHALPPDEHDLRERSLIVESIRLES